MTELEESNKINISSKEEVIKTLKSQLIRTKDQYEAEMAIASPGKGWGFCSEECNKGIDQGFDVKYTGLGIMAYLSDEKCANLLGVNLNIHNKRLKLQKAIYFSNRNSFCKNSSRILIAKGK